MYILRFVRSSLSLVTTHPVHLRVQRQKVRIKPRRWLTDRLFFFDMIDTRRTNPRSKRPSRNPPLEFLKNPRSFDDPHDFRKSPSEAMVKLHTTSYQLFQVRTRISYCITKVKLNNVLSNENACYHGRNAPINECRRGGIRRVCGLS